MSTKGDWAGWLSLCLRATIHEAVGALRRVDRLLAIKRKYEIQLGHVKKASARLNKIVDNLMSSPLITIPATAREFGTTFPTASADIQKLVSLGILQESPRKSKPKYFIAAEFYSAAYTEDSE